jgi:anti-sigma regulatory factor (Ser/Thr protein kinase)
MSAAPDGAPAGAGAGRPTGMWHEAMAYSSPPELVGDLVPRIGGAIDAGDVVTAVLDDEIGGQVRSALGAAADDVQFLDPRSVHSVPGFTTALRWSRLGRAVDASGNRAVVGQQLLDLPGCGPAYWARLCLGLEVAMAGLPLTVLCPFPDGPANRARTDEMHQQPGPNRRYRLPADVIREHPPRPRPDLGPPAAELRFRDGDLGELRHLATVVAGHGGLPPERVADLVLAVNELATNSLEHGPGSGWLRLWTDDGVVAEVADAGRLDEPFPGMVRPSPDGPRGRGLWLASELCDVMEVWTDNGTVIRLSWEL